MYNLFGGYISRFARYTQATLGISCFARYTQATLGISCFARYKTRQTAITNEIADIAAASLAS